MINLSSHLVLGKKINKHISQTVKTISLNHVDVENQI